jgi:hypothetical protein
MSSFLARARKNQLASWFSFGGKIDCVDNIQSKMQREATWCHLPVNSNSHEGENAGRNCTRCNELRELAIGSAERPVAVQHVEGVEHRIEYGDQCVGHGQIHQEVVCHRAHALMTENDPNDDRVATGGDDHHRRKGEDVDHLSYGIGR